MVLLGGWDLVLRSPNTETPNNTSFRNRSVRYKILSPSNKQCEIAELPSSRRRQRAVCVLAKPSSYVRSSLPRHHLHLCLIKHVFKKKKYKTEICESGYLLFLSSLSLSSSSLLLFFFFFSSSISRSILISLSSSMLLLLLFALEFAFCDCLATTLIALSRSFNRRQFGHRITPPPNILSKLPPLLLLILLLSIVVFLFYQSEQTA